MKKFIQSVLFFFVFATLFYVFAILLSGKILPKRLIGNILTENKVSAKDGSRRRYEDVDKLKHVDVMILGSSHAYRGYDPRIFKNAGYTCYNLGSSSQRLNLTSFIYSNYNKRLKPKKIVIDIYPVLLGSTVGEGDINLLPIFYQNNSFVKKIFRTFDVRILNSFIYLKTFGNPKTIISEKPAGERYIPGGYISSSKVTKSENKFGNTVLNVNENNIDALKNIVVDAKKNGIEVFLFQAPIPKARYASYKNNKEIDSIISSIGKYYNYNEEEFLPTEYFMDDSHINQKGVDVYNKWVIDKIKENE